MSAYMIYVGSVNVLGTFLLLGALSDDFSDLLLRRFSRIIPDDVPFRHSEYSRVWLWWAIIGTGFFGALNLVASSWPPEYARVIVWGNVYAYASFELLAIAGSLSPRYGSGIHLCHLLWIGQGGWGVWAALR
jgi:hypothetical protein